MGEIVNHFDLIYEQHSDRVYSYVYAVAEDLTQDTFVKVYKKLYTFKGDSSVSTWVFSIARNKTIDYIRRKQRLAFFSIGKKGYTDPNPTPVEIVEKGEAVERLYASINQLKLEYREVIILRKIKELTIKETAEVLGWKEEKVKLTTSRAYAALKKLMIEEDTHDQSSGAN
ncbi:RNA polymerase sigma factor [Bacillus tianshenii]|uniref:RNA polymerase sigma factor n=1 Tax=Sutcliffiella tianshenii TaxID=1463404 RepID=UPI001CD31F9C|nr:RNA polymerase sigma factor [Bacillus tianshenii]MCA1318303.1 RNA polymerase sigma factor [Bacillus tianshenii]